MEPEQEAPGADRPGGAALLRRVALDLTPLRESPPFRRLWVGETIATVAWRLTLVAVPVQVYRITQSPLAVGLLALTQFVPLVTLTILGGAVADTVDRRKLLIVSSVGVQAAMIALAANAALPHPRVSLCFVLSFLAYASFSIGAGAQRSVTPRLVPPEQLTAASALNGLASNLASVAGPAVAGVAVTAVGLGWTYGAAFAGATAGTWAVSRLPALPPGGEAERVTLAAVAGGFRYLASQHVILAFFLIDTVAMIFGMPNALFPALAEHLFHDATTVGYLYAAPAAGAVAASLLSGWLRHVRRQGVAIAGAAALWGAAIAGFGLSRALWVGLLLLALAGAADQVSAIFRSTIVLTVTPDHMLGRLGGIEFAQVASTPALGNLEAGAVASLAGLTFSVVSGGVACVVATVAVALAFPALLRYDAHPRQAAA